MMSSMNSANVERDAQAYSVQISEQIAINLERMNRVIG